MLLYFEAIFHQHFLFLILFHRLYDTYYFVRHYILMTYNDLLRNFHDVIQLHVIYNLRINQDY